MQFHSQEQTVRYGSNLVSNNIRASFYADRNTGPTPNWGARANSHIRQCYVRIIQGKYDSGRVESGEATSIYDNNFYTAYKSRIKTPFHTTYTSYGWNKYF